MLSLDLKLDRAVNRKPSACKPFERHDERHLQDDAILDIVPQLSELSFPFVVMYDYLYLGVHCFVTV